MKPISERITIGITYETWTPEDVEIGDTDDRGWKYETQPYCRGDLRQCQGIYTEASDCYVQASTWFVEPDGDTDYRTGAVTTRALHIGGVTTATMRRIFRYLNGKCVLGYAARQVGK